MIEKITILLDSEIHRLARVHGVNMCFEGRKAITERVMREELRQKGRTRNESANSLHGEGT
jgi:hypothetical protein